MAKIRYKNNCVYRKKNMDAYICFLIYVERLKYIYSVFIKKYISTRLLWKSLITTESFVLKSNRQSAIFSYFLRSMKRVVKGHFFFLLKKCNITFWSARIRVYPCYLCIQLSICWPTQVFISFSKQSAQGLTTEYISKGKMSKIKRIF